MALAITWPMRLRKTGSSYIGSSSYGGSKSCDCKIVYPAEQLQSVFPANGLGIGPPVFVAENTASGIANVQNRCLPKANIINKVLRHIFGATDPSARALSCVFPIGERAMFGLSQAAIAQCKCAIFCSIPPVAT
jgi:hypothetical protein